MSYLDLLIGKKVKQIHSEFEEFTSIINKGEKFQEHNYDIVLQFEDEFYLAIYNPFCVKFGLEVGKLENSIVKTFDSDDKEAVISFSNGSRIRIDLRDESYIGPEAMCLSGPNNLCVVWRGDE